MPVDSIRVSERNTSSERNPRPRRPSALLAGALLLLFLAVLGRPAVAQAQDGACCTVAGACTVATETACVSPRMWQGAETTCSPNPCPPPTGACCTLTGDACTVTLEADCTDGRTWQGWTVPSCEPTPCRLGACCASGQSCALSTRALCKTPSTWQGAGTTCDATICQTGACCKFDSTCAVTTATLCETVGSWQGAGTLCTSTICNTGACCGRNGECAITTEALCDLEQNLGWEGAGTLCDPNPCVGACCDLGRNCTITTLPACLSPSTWQGPATTCIPDPCPKPPTLAQYRFLSPDTLSDGDPRPLTREDTVVILTRWEVANAPQLADSLQVSADFSRLDPGVTGNHAVPGQWIGDGWYRVAYPLSGVATRSDTSGVRIPLRATAVTGSTIDRRVRVCLSNHPPVHASTRVLEPKDSPYRSGDSLVIQTVWHSPDALSLQITASFAAVDTAGPVMPGTDQGNGVFVIRYRLPLSRELMPPDGDGKSIAITARDAGCGETTDTSLRVSTDTEPPPSELLSIDPLPEVTTAESLLVSGEAPEAAVVRILRNRAQHGDAVVDPVTGRYGGMLALLPGENKIQVRGEDAAGNSSLPFPASPGGVIVNRIADADLFVSAPYSRKDNSADAIDDIVLRNPEPMEGVVIRIFNLEGDCLWEERPTSTGQMLEHRFHWTGINRGGDRAPQGYYLVRAEWRRTNGESRSTTKGLLLRD